MLQNFTTKICHGNFNSGFLSHEVWKIESPLIIAIKIADFWEFFGWIICSKFLNKYIFRWIFKLSFAVLCWELVLFLFVPPPTRKSYYFVKLSLRSLEFQIFWIFRADEDSDFTKTTFLVLFIVGCVMTLIGGLGYFYTIYEVLQRAHKKFRERQLRKLEQQVVRRRTETMARTRTIALTMEREKAMSMNGGGPPVWWAE